jgi:hypothetical protein
MEMKENRCSLAVILTSMFTLTASVANATEIDIVLNEFVLWSDAGGNNVIRVSTPAQELVNNAGCLEPDSYMVRSSLEKPTQARIFATLLAAKSLGKPVTARIDGCESNRPAIISVYF